MANTNDVPANFTKITPPLQMRIGKVASYALYVWVTIGLVSLGLRVFLLLFSANPSAPFVDFIYRVSADYLAPFRDIFPPRPIGETGYFDVAAVFAIFIYLILTWLVTALIAYVQQKIDQHDAEQRQLLAHEQSTDARSAKRTARSSN